MTRSKLWPVLCGALLVLAACSSRTEADAFSGPSAATSTSSGSSASVSTDVASRPVTSQPVTASPTVRACSRGDLAARYAGAGAGGQTFFGGIVVWNVSDQPCKLVGSVGFSAYYPDESRDVNAEHDLRYSRTVSIVMPASTQPFRDRVSVGSAYVWAQLSAPEFAAPGETDCASPPRATYVPPRPHGGSAHVRRRRQRR